MRFKGPAPSVVGGSVVMVGSGWGGGSREKGIGVWDGGGMDVWICATRDERD